jgi:hypothetical protein
MPFHLSVGKVSENELQAWLWLSGCIFRLRHRLFCGIVLRDIMHI